MNDVTATDEGIEVESTVVGCDGGGGALGHPLVYLNMDPATEIVCPYCSRRFVLKAGADRTVSL
jgi:uncharacterized Zn-finger protein